MSRWNVNFNTIKIVFTLISKIKRWKKNHTFHIRKTVHSDGNLNGNWGVHTLRFEAVSAAAMRKNSGSLLCCCCCHSIAGARIYYSISACAFSVLYHIWPYRVSNCVGIKKLPTHETGWVDKDTKASSVLYFQLNEWTPNTWCCSISIYSSSRISRSFGIPAQVLRRHGRIWYTAETNLMLQHPQRDLCWISFIYHINIWGMRLQGSNLTAYRTYSLAFGLLTICFE